MSTTRPDTKQGALTEAEEIEIGLENVRRMFRHEMAQSIRPGESVAAARARIAKDPATAEVARLLRTSVDALLEGFGTPQVMVVPESYDHARAKAEMDAIIDATLAAPLGLGDGRIPDVLGGEIRHAGAHAARREGAPRRQVFGDPESAKLIRAQWSQPARPPGVVARAARR